MKKINELFKKVTQEEINEKFVEYGFNVPNDIKFSNVNVVIGANGAGKSRLLNIIKELYQKCGNEVIYGYFPALSDKPIDVEEKSFIPEVELYDMCFGAQTTYENFLKTVEHQNALFLEKFLKYNSRRQKEIGNTTFKAFQNTFADLTGYKIIEKNAHIYLIDKNDVSLTDLSNEDMMIDIAISENLLIEKIKKFSPGQLMLFYMSLFISIQIDKGKKIIILDEPECHLHPAALIKFINAVKRSNLYSELWIATHSLFVIPEFDFENIIYIENSMIAPRKSDLYSKILTEMVGKNYAKSMQFVAAFKQWQYYNFIFDCFTQPTVVDTIDSNDEQVRLFINFLEEHKTFKILDFGGGSARLGNSIFASDFENKDKIEYYVYDKYLNDEKIEELSKQGITAFKDIGIINSNFDCVVMMNVLHEIEPKDWVQEFDDIKKIMNDGAYLFFVENAELNKGEMPMDTGYLVLGKEELEVLFNSKNAISNITLKNKKQKSLGVAIPKKVITKISSETTFKTITKLKERSYNSLISERNKLKKAANLAKKENRIFNDNDDPEFNARKYAFHMQQYMNARLYCEENALEYDSMQPSVEINNKKYMSRDLAEIILNEIDNMTIEHKLDATVYRTIRPCLLSFRSECFVDDMSLQKLANRYSELKEENNEPEITSLCLFVLFVIGDNNARRDFNRSNCFESLPSCIKRHFKCEKDQNKSPVTV